MAHRVSVAPVRVSEPDPDLGCNVLHTIGYRWTCSCGDRGRIVQPIAAARAAARAHRRGGGGGSSSSSTPS